MTSGSCSNSHLPELLNRERIEQLLKMLEKEPGDLFLNYALGLEYAKDLKTFADAESQFRQVLAIDENYFAACYQLGQLYEQLLRKPQAIEAYTAGLEIAERSGNKKAANEFREALFMLED